jgi:HD superfamily phosphohydrolase
MRLPYDDVHPIADPLYGYLRITVPEGDDEVAEATIIDDQWVQRLKRIHQLQSSWWVFPSAEHSRFAHSLGVMHLSGEIARQVYDTLAEVEPGTPSAPLVEETLRLAGLLHDIGHGPFSHFCDEQYLLPEFGLDHERISQHLIVNELGDALVGVERSPSGRFDDGERVDPRHVAWLIHAQDVADLGEMPRWVRLLHSVLSGAVTADNMDYVRRDAYMCGVSLSAVDVPRLIYYSFVTDEGLTFHKRALNALRAFLNARFYMYENVYFHRIGHAIDLHMREIFAETMRLVLPDNPLQDLDAYKRLTEWSLFTEVERWRDEPGAATKRRRLAEEWQAIIHRDVKYRMVFEQAIERQRVAAATRELTRDEFAEGIRRALPASLKQLEFVCDVASQDPRPLNPMTGPKRIPVFDPATGKVEEELLTGILEFVPAKAHLYRVFATTHEHDRELGDAARTALVEAGATEASLTNL